MRLALHRCGWLNPSQHWTGEIRWANIPMCLRDFQLVLIGTYPTIIRCIPMEKGRCPVLETAVQFATGPELATNRRHIGELLDSGDTSRCQNIDIYDARISLPAEGCVMQMFGTLKGSDFCSATCVVARTEFI